MFFNFHVYLLTLFMLLPIFFCLEYAGEASMQINMHCSYLFAMDW